MFSPHNIVSNSFAIETPLHPMAATPSHPRTTHFQNDFPEAYHNFESVLPDRPNELKPPTNIPDHSPYEDVPTEPVSIDQSSARTADRTDDTSYRKIH